MDRRQEKIAANPAQEYSLGKEKCCNISLRETICSYAPIGNQQITGLYAVMRQKETARLQVFLQLCTNRKPLDCRSLYTPIGNHCIDYKSTRSYAPIGNHYITGLYAVMRRQETARLQVFMQFCTNRKPLDCRSLYAPKGNNLYIDYKSSRSYAPIGNP